MFVPFIKGDSLQNVHARVWKVFDPKAVYHKVNSGLESDLLETISGVITSGAIPVKKERTFLAWKRVDSVSREWITIENWEIVCGYTWSSIPINLDDKGATQDQW